MKKDSILRAFASLILLCGSSNLGAVTFHKFVALGDSLPAGFSRRLPHRSKSGAERLVPDRDRRLGSPISSSL